MEAPADLPEINLWKVNQVWVTHLRKDGIETKAYVGRLNPEGTAILGDPLEKPRLREQIFYKYTDTQKIITIVRYNILFDETNKNYKTAEDVKGVQIKEQIEVYSRKDNSLISIYSWDYTHTPTFGIFEMGELIDPRENKFQTFNFMARNGMVLSEYVEVREEYIKNTGDRTLSGFAKHMEDAGFNLLIKSERILNMDEGYPRWDELNSQNFVFNSKRGGDKNGNGNIKTFEGMLVFNQTDIFYIPKYDITNGQFTKNKNYDSEVKKALGEGLFMIPALKVTEGGIDRNLRPYQREAYISSVDRKTVLMENITKYLYSLEGEGVFPGVSEELTRLSDATTVITGVNADGSFKRENYKKTFVDYKENNATFAVERVEKTMMDGKTEVTKIVSKVLDEEGKEVYSFTIKYRKHRDHMRLYETETNVYKYVTEIDEFKIKREDYIYDKDEKRPRVDAEYLSRKKFVFLESSGEFFEERKYDPFTKGERLSTGTKSIKLDFEDPKYYRGRIKSTEIREYDPLQYQENGKFYVVEKKLIKVSEKTDFGVTERVNSDGSVYAVKEQIKNQDGTIKEEILVREGKFEPEKFALNKLTTGEKLDKQGRVVSDVNLNEKYMDIYIGDGNGSIKGESGKIRVSLPSSAQEGRMEQYNIPTEGNGLVTSVSFSESASLKAQTGAIMVELANKGYIDRYGVILKPFYDLKNADEMALSQNLSTLKQEIFNVMKSRAHKPFLTSYGIYDVTGKLWYKDEREFHPMKNLEEHRIYILHPSNNQMEEFMYIVHYGKDIPKEVNERDKTIPTTHKFSILTRYTSFQKEDQYRIVKEESSGKEYVTGHDYNTSKFVLGVYDKTIDDSTSDLPVASTSKHWDYATDKIGKLFERGLYIYKDELYERFILNITGLTGDLGKIVDLEDSIDIAIKTLYYGKEVDSSVLNKIKTLALDLSLSEESAIKALYNIKTDKNTKVFDIIFKLEKFRETLKENLLKKLAETKTKVAVYRTFLETGRQYESEQWYAPLIIGENGNIDIDFNQGEKAVVKMDLKGFFGLMKAEAWMEDYFVTSQLERTPDGKYKVSAVYLGKDIYQFEGVAGKKRVRELFEAFTDLVSVDGNTGIFSINAQINESRLDNYLRDMGIPENNFKQLDKTGKIKLYLEKILSIDSRTSKSLAGVIKTYGYDIKDEAYSITIPGKINEQGQISSDYKEGVFYLHKKVTTSGKPLGLVIAKFRLKKGEKESIEKSWERILSKRAPDTFEIDFAKEGSRLSDFGDIENIYYIGYKEGNDTNKLYQFKIPITNNKIEGEIYATLYNVQENKVDTRQGWLYRIVSKDAKGADIYPLKKTKDLEITLSDIKAIQDLLPSELQDKTITGDDKDVVLYGKEMLSWVKKEITDNEIGTTITNSTLGNITIMNFDLGLNLVQYAQPSGSPEIKYQLEINKCEYASNVIDKALEEFSKNKKDNIFNKDSSIWVKNQVYTMARFTGLIKGEKTEDIKRVIDFIKLSVRMKKIIRPGVFDVSSLSGGAITTVLSDLISINELYAAEGEQNKLVTTDDLTSEAMNALYWTYMLGMRQDPDSGAVVLNSESTWKAFEEQISQLNKVTIETFNVMYKDRLKDGGLTNKGFIQASGLITFWASHSGAELGFDFGFREFVDSIIEVAQYKNLLEEYLVKKNKNYNELNTEELFKLYVSTLYELARLIVRYGYGKDEIGVVIKGQIELLKNTAYKDVRTEVDKAIFNVRLIRFIKWIMSTIVITWLLTAVVRFLYKFNVIRDDASARYKASDNWREWIIGETTGRAGHVKQSGATLLESAGDPKLIPVADKIKNLIFDMEDVIWDATRRLEPYKYKLIAKVTLEDINKVNQDILIKALNDNNIKPMLDKIIKGLKNHPVTAHNLGDVIKAIGNKYGKFAVDMKHISYKDTEPMISRNLSKYAKNKFYKKLLLTLDGQKFSKNFVNKLYAPFNYIVSMENMKNPAIPLTGMTRVLGWALVFSGALLFVSKSISVMDYASWEILLTGMVLITAGIWVNKYSIIDFIMDAKSAMHSNRLLRSITRKQEQKDVVDFMIKELEGVRKKLEDIMDAEIKRDGSLLTSEDWKKIMTFTVLAPYGDAEDNIRLTTKEINIISYINYTIDYLAKIKKENRDYNLISRGHFPWYDPQFLVSTIYAEGKTFSQASFNDNDKVRYELFPGSFDKKEKIEIDGRSYNKPDRIEYNGPSVWSNSTQAIPINNLPLYLGMLQYRLRRINNDLAVGENIVTAIKHENEDRAFRAHKMAESDKGFGGPSISRSSYWYGIRRHMKSIKQLGIISAVILPIAYYSRRILELNGFIPVIEVNNFLIFSLVTLVALVSGFLFNVMLQKAWFFIASYLGKTEGITTVDIKEHLPKALLIEILNGIKRDMEKDNTSIPNYLNIEISESTVDGIMSGIIKEEASRKLRKKLIKSGITPSKWPSYRMLLNYPVLHAFYFKHMDREKLVKILRADTRFDRISDSFEPKGPVNNEDILKLLKLDDIKYLVEKKGKELFPRVALMETTFSGGAGQKLVEVVESAIRTYPGGIDVFPVTDDVDIDGIKAMNLAIYGNDEGIEKGQPSENINKPWVGKLYEYRDSIRIVACPEHGVNYGKNQRKIRMKPPLNSEEVRFMQRFYAERGEDLPYFAELVDEEDRLTPLLMMQKLCVGPLPQRLLNGQSELNIITQFIKQMKKLLRNPEIDGELNSAT
ncbi:membrane protein [Candidatus Omnitrophus magneticus]|uniref:Membrane protein n=1 Tax=Candidatus Omnitrophus magneticus TaxID=1609969 RepID=A0A0F0CJ82_9BACT|nr:membrane protein [Candidatus Omnitrophus magneticus]